MRLLDILTVENKQTDRRVSNQHRWTKYPPGCWCCCCC